MKLNLIESEVDALLEARRAQIELLTRELNRTLDLLVLEQSETDFLMGRVRDLSDQVSSQTRTDIQAENRVRQGQIAVVEELLKAIFGSNKISAIKAARQLTGLGLKESKDLVEKYWGQYCSLEIKQVPHP